MEPLIEALIQWVIDNNQVLSKTFDAITTELSGSSYPNMQMIYQFFVYIKSTVATAVVSDVPIVAEAALAMEEKLNVYDDLVVCDESAVAYVSDPRLKRFASLDAATQGATRDKVLALGAKSFKNTRHDRVAREANKPVSFFESLSGAQEAARTGSELTTVEQLEEYGKAAVAGFKTDIRNWWKMHERQWPLLAKVARFCMKWSQPLFRQSAYSSTPGT
ncbi:Ribonuclease H-like domain [Plasmopara halstedii]|uniref:Ribonuclease H-like domain n=1 Tax=Plasmopara halstedii TaxID=4781 RepID=A0A0P1AZ19_PLAHL|nr:Ribonuclease H-like domain [Plasmopara halstedii]CEG46143.1 Ribonuclease H-like domain [Plasmopara halstedii]|eukprot:XP_024582512.1 Ribonuclease H-like domain [Plasmopara halstedii]